MKSLIYCSLLGSLLGSLVFIWTSCGSSAGPTAGDTLFSLLDANTTGIDFENVVEDGKEFNVLTYRNFYNGGGVAIGDIDNDGLSDLYFTANMGPNKLYRNKGNLQFEDITEAAGVAGTKAWSTGVAMADINADGLLDIYVCNSGDIAGDNKENELFINQGDGTFVEAAAEWGLNNQGFSTHASFFDYDGDGDLDCYLLNNSFRSPERIEMYRKKRVDIDQEGGDKLLRNDGDHFTDVTEEAGIFTSDIGFGLGVSVSDLNNDMLPDIYISNDFWERDYLYLNNGDGTFTEALTARTDICSMSSMGADIADINNDGSPEIMTTDMLPGDNFRLKSMTHFDPFHLEDMKYSASYHYQILQNCLHLNNGAADFQEVAHLSGVAATDWSWGALMLDFDNDGWKDIFVSNGIFRDLTDRDFRDFISDKENIRELVSETNRADWRDFLPHMPSTKISNYAFLNQGDLSFADKSAELGLDEPSFSNGAAYGDLDNDGDLELVVNNVNMPSFIYKNNTTEKKQHNYLKIKFKGAEPNLMGLGAKVRIYSKGRQQEAQHYLSRGFESGVEPGLVFGLGKTEMLDTVQIIWPNQQEQILTDVAANQTLEVEQINATQAFAKNETESATLFTEVTEEVFSEIPVHQENRFNDFDQERLLPRMLSTQGPKVLRGDVNRDGLKDVILLGAADQVNQLYVQQADGQFVYQEQLDFKLHKSLESTCGALFDADGDNDLDLIVGSGGNEFSKGPDNFVLLFYENDGNGNFNINLGKTPPARGQFSCIEPSDIDRDGDLDLFVGARSVPGNYGLVPASFVFSNDGNGNWTDLTTEQFGRLGMVTDAVWTDINGNGFKDLVVTGDWMPITIFVNKGGKLEKVDSERFIKNNTNGWWTAIEAADLDGDGDQDFVLGNWGLNTKFKASEQQPLSMYVKDFDNNGKSEFIINWHPPLEQQAYPFADKMDITAQMPHLKKRILKYQDYAKMTYEELLTPEERKGALYYQATELRTSVLWNEADGMRLEALPTQAQIAPVFAIEIQDFDNDGVKDIFLAGNFFGLKPEVGRHASGNGVMLKGSGDGQFTVLSSEKTGVLAEGEVRSIVPLGENPLMLLIAKNNDAVQVVRATSVLQ